MAPVKVDPPFRNSTALDENTGMTTLNAPERDGVSGVTVNRFAGARCGRLQIIIHNAVQLMVLTN